LAEQFCIRGQLMGTNAYFRRAYGFKPRSILIFEKCGINGLEMYPGNVMGSLRQDYGSCDMSRSERGDTLTAAITLTNKSPYYVFLLLVDKPHAVNDAGEVFDTGPSVNGVAWCKGWDSYPSGLTAPHREKRKICPLPHKAPVMAP
jgi:hypothetical protein